MLGRSEKAEVGMRAKRGKKSGAFSASATWFSLARLRLLGGRRRHHRGRDYAYREIGLLALSPRLVSSGCIFQSKETVLTSLEACDWGGDLDSSTKKVRQ